MTELGHFLRGRGISQKDFSAQLGVDQSVMSRFVNGQARPGLDLAVKIERVTGGAVPVETWVSKEGAAA